MVTKMKVCFYLALGLLLGGIVALCLGISFGKVAVIVGLACVVAAIVFVVLAFVCALKLDYKEYKPDDDAPKAH
jgi:hypothetical protein